MTGAWGINDPDAAAPGGSHRLASASAAWGANDPDAPTRADLSQLTDDQLQQLYRGVSGASSSPPVADIRALSNDALRQLYQQSQRSLPAGFVLDQPELQAATPAQAISSATGAQLPPGFKIDTPDTFAGASDAAARWATFGLADPFAAAGRSRPTVAWRRHRYRFWNSVQPEPATAARRGGEFCPGAPGRKRHCRWCGSLGECSAGDGLADRPARRGAGIGNRPGIGRSDHSACMGKRGAHDGQSAIVRRRPSCRRRRARCGAGRDQLAG
jgi:hypothetical protein